MDHSEIKRPASVMVWVKHIDEVFMHVIEPEGFWWGRNDKWPEWQWFLKAVDLHKEERIDIPMKLVTKWHETDEASNSNVPNDTFTFNPELWAERCNRGET